MVEWSEVFSAFPSLVKKQEVEDALHYLGVSPMDLVDKKQPFRTITCESTGITGWEIQLNDKIKNVKASSQYDDSPSFYSISSVVVVSSLL